METKFRPLPLSLIDFFGVIVPGFVWLVLLVTVLLIVTTPGPITPATSWQVIAKQTSTDGIGLGPPLAIILVSIVLGYVLKARAIQIATPIALPWMKLDPALRGRQLSEAIFPYTALHLGKTYYAAVLAITTKVVGVPVDDLPGYQPFGTAKRLLRLLAPQLWEELEHREAEIRLLANTVNAAAFSVCIAAVEMVSELTTGTMSARPFAWMAVSLVALFSASDAFNHLRLREVSYAYMYLLIAVGAKHPLEEEAVAGSDEQSE